MWGATGRRHPRAAPPPTDRLAQGGMGTVADGTRRERRAVRYLRVPGGNHPGGRPDHADGVCAQTVFSEALPFLCIFRARAATLYLEGI